MKKAKLVTPEDETVRGAGVRKNDADAPAEDRQADFHLITEKWKRALADSENARKRADAAYAEGCEHGIAVAVEALAPALDALALGVEAARNHPDADDHRIVGHLEGLRNIRAAFETGLKALGVRSISPENEPFDPKLHEAVKKRKSDDTTPGQVLVLHRPGFSIGQRLIRPARVTVSAAPTRGATDTGSEA